MDEATQVPDARPTSAQPLKATMQLKLDVIRQQHLRKKYHNKSLIPIKFSLKIHSQN